MLQNKINGPSNYFSVFDVWWKSKIFPGWKTFFLTRHSFKTFKVIKRWKIHCRLQCDNFYFSKLTKLVLTGINSNVLNLRYNIVINSLQQWRRFLKDLITEKTDDLITIVFYYFCNLAVSWVYIIASMFQLWETRKADSRH